MRPPIADEKKDAQRINIDEIRAKWKLFHDARSVKEATCRDELQTIVLNQYCKTYNTVPERYLRDEKFR